MGLKENQQLAEQYPILQYFKGDHLTNLDLGQIYNPFRTLAWKLARELPRNAETSTALRKLLEAKEAAVRAHFEIYALDEVPEVNKRLLKSYSKD